MVYIFYNFTPIENLRSKHISKSMSTQQLEYLGLNNLLLKIALLE